MNNFIIFDFIIHILLLRRRRPPVGGLRRSRKCRASRWRIVSSGADWAGLWLWLGVYREMYTLHCESI